MWNIPIMSTYVHKLVANICMTTARMYIYEYLKHVQHFRANQFWFYPPKFEGEGFLIIF